MKKKHKGFSLIELIIAIAILVILTGLLAPQFMKYIESAKRAKGIQTLDSFNNGLQVAFIDALTDSIDRKASNGYIVLNRGETMGSVDAMELDESLLANLKSVIGDEELKKSVIMIAFAKEGLSVDKAETYYMDGVSIQYYPKDGSYDFYYYVDGVCANGKYLGNYGERKNGQYIQWK